MVNLNNEAPFEARQSFNRSIKGCVALTPDDRLVCITDLAREDYAGDRVFVVFEIQDPSEAKAHFYQGFSWEARERDLTPVCPDDPGWLSCALRRRAQKKAEEEGGVLHEHTPSCVSKKGSPRL